MEVDVLGPGEVDREEYLAAANTAFLSSRTVGELDWKWSDNGYGEPLFVVARDDASKLVGSLCFGAFAVLAEDRPHQARLSYDTFVSPQARGSGVFTALLREASRALGGDDIAFNFPNASSTPGFRSNGWVQMQTARQYVTPALVGRGRRPAVAQAAPADTAGAATWLRSGASVSWAPSPAHVGWRLRHPAGATHLLSAGEVHVLASVHRRSRVRELRVLEVWSPSSIAETTSAVRSIAAHLRCHLVTLPLSALPRWRRDQLLRSGWLPRPSKVRLHVWQGSDRSGFQFPWRLSGVFFHTW
jgi:GNAT superfamily N-acetyltransferase